MKRFWTGVLTWVMLLALAAPASADVLWTPINDSFFEKHYAECTFVGRSYYANGAEGFVTMWNAPGSTAVIHQFENGEKLSVAWIYEDWGCVNARVDGEWIDGWIPMEELVLIYDHISFAEEYADQIQPYGGEFADYEGSLAVINFYEYPGAPEVKIEYSYNEREVRKVLTGSGDAPSYIQSVYVDEQGLTWGFVGYMYGHMDAWFCLDDPDGVNDPESVDFPVRQVEATELIPAQIPSMPAQGYIPYILVGAVVVVTAGLLAVFFRRKKHM